MTIGADGGGYLYGEDARDGRGGANAAADRDGGGVLIGDGDATFVIYILSRNHFVYWGGAAGMSQLSRLSKILMLSTSVCVDTQNKLYFAILAINVFILFLASKESNVFFVLISIII